MITPNFDLMLWLILASWTINSICRIILGSVGYKKDPNFTIGDVIIGLIGIIIVIITIMN